MAFELPPYSPPDFSRQPLSAAPPAVFRPVTQDGVAPEGYHATSIFPEYFRIDGDWRLLADSRMDCVAVLRPAGALEAKEPRRLEVGERVACGRKEDGSEGILVHAEGFRAAQEEGEKFAFRTGLTRESSFSIDYDQLYELLEHERREGFVLWVAGPAVVFDRDSRGALSRLVETGFVHGLLAGNALATHDVEAAMFGTALGVDIYSKRQAPQGHYRHLDALNRVRQAGSLAACIEAGLIGDGVMHALIRGRIPFVLAGSIRDDGPLPEVVADVCAAQDRMRELCRRATTVIALATQLHTIATGNMTPAYRVLPDGRVRPVYFYSVDMSEFAVGKLVDRGSLTARAILTNVQDFVVNVERGLRKRG